MIENRPETSQNILLPGANLQRRKEERYHTAVMRLRTFVDLDTTGVLTMRDLARFLAGIPGTLVTVAESIKRRAVTHGGVYQALVYNKADPIMGDPQSIESSNSIQGEEVSVSLFWDRSEISIVKSKARADSALPDIMYEVICPRRIDPERGPKVQMASAYAIDYETHGDSRPAQNPNQFAQQEYVSILQEGIKDVLAFLPN